MALELLTVKLCLLLLCQAPIGSLAGRIQKIDTLNSQPAIKGTSIRLACYISQFSSLDLVYIYKSDSSVLTGSLPDTSQTNCFPSFCFTTDNGRYTYSAGSGHVYINVTNLNRSEDQKWWTCVLGSQRKGVYLTIYTVPQTLRFDRLPNQDQDLAENAVTLRCSTNCTYPQPSFKWFYTELGGSRQNWSTLGFDTDTTGGCTDSEKIYTSTLSLAKYSTFPGNLDKTVKFTCGIPTFTGMTEPLYTNPSVNIQFAVKVTSVTLMSGNIKAPSSVKVTGGISTHFTCTTSASRPASKYVWYIGEVEKQRSTSVFTFTPQESDHNKQVYCKAFNTQPESQAVSSNKATLAVQVQVANVTLKDGNSQAASSIKVTSGVSKTLTCATSFSRPNATVIWFLSGKEQTRSNSSYTFTFTPNNNDHEKQIFCKAFNIQNEKQAVSSPKATLYVQVPATTPKLTNQTTEILAMMENDSVSMECISSSTRPVAIVTWKKGTQRLTNVQNINSTTSDGLMSVRSIVKFTPVRIDNNENIVCETAIPGQQNKIKTQQRITVYWPPSAPSIPTKDFPFLEGQSGKTLSCSSNEYGNPRSSATWNSNYGTQDTSDSKILNLPMLNKDIDKSNVSCQLKNNFTQAKGLAVTSPTIIMDIQYKPVVQIMAGGQSIQSITTIEGENLAAHCSAVGNPVPIVNWIGQTSTGSELRFNDTDRKDHGTYTCRAEATSEKYRDHDFVTLRNLSVVVFCIPSIPKFLKFTGIVDGVPTFLLQGSFNGGRPQYFRVETSILGMENWKERLTFNETDKTFLLDNKLTFHFNVTGLTPNTYEIRVLAGNDLGWIENKDAPVTTFIVQDTETGADIVLGAVGGAAAGVVIIAIVVVVVVMYRQNSCTKENVRIIVGKMIRKKKTTNENRIEMSSQDNPVGMYEQLQRNEERGNTNVYDSLEVITDNTVYENLPTGAVGTSAYATVHTAAPKDSSHAIYENLKLNL